MAFKWALTAILISFLGVAFRQQSIPPMNLSPQIRNDYRASLGAGTSLRRASSPGPAHPRNRHTPAFAQRGRSRQSTLLIRRFGQGGGKRRAVRVVIFGRQREGSYRR